jgi:hypothetical protein
MDMVNISKNSYQQYEGASDLLPHPLYPPLLARLSAGEGDDRERGASPLLNTPIVVD